MIGSKKYYVFNRPALYLRVCLLNPGSGDDCISIYMNPTYLFDVSSSSTVEEISKNQIRIEWGNGIVGYVASTGEPCNIPDCYKDIRYVYDFTVGPLIFRDKIVEKWGTLNMSFPSTV